MKTLGAALFSMFFAQFLKVFSKRPFNFSRIASSGGMPSSHSSFVTCLATVIGVKHGFNSDLFAVVVVFALIIMYDATGVRRAVGEQAKIINRLIEDLTTGEKKEMIYKELKELVGHTPVEVLVGAVLGILLGLIFFYLG